MSSTDEGSELLSEDETSYVPDMRERPSSRMERPVVIGPYHLGNELGRGFYGIVRKALNVETGDFVAVKSLSLAGFDDAATANIEREITTLRSLSHRHIVQYQRFIKQGTCLHLVLEFVENGSLRDIVKRFGALPETIVQTYARQILDALSYLHGLGIVHRDIKASNILITKDGQCKLADFGACFRTSEGDSEDIVAALGAPYWMAPEVTSGQELVHLPAMDIWSFGCTLFELLTGTPPWGHLQPLAALFKVHSQPFPPLPDYVQCSDELRNLIFSCCQQEASARPTANELLSHKFFSSDVVPERMVRMKTAKDLKTLLQEHGRQQAPDIENQRQRVDTMFVDVRTMVNRHQRWTPALVVAEDPAVGSISLEAARLGNQLSVQLRELEGCEAELASDASDVEAGVGDADVKVAGGRVAALERELKAAYAAHHASVSIAAEMKKLLAETQVARKACLKVAEAYKNIAEEAVMDRKKVLIKLQTVEDQWSPSESFNEVQADRRGLMVQLRGLRALEAQLPVDQLATYVFGNMSSEHMLSLAPQLVGWANKRSIKGESSEGVSRKTQWKSRFFVLKANFLVYYKTDKDSAPVGIVHLSRFSICKGAVMGLNNLGIEHLKSGKSPETFLSLTSRELTYVLEVEAKEMRETWVRVLKQRRAWYDCKDVVDGLVRRSTP